MKRFFTTVIAVLTLTVATGAVASSTAQACGPYGDPVAFAELDVAFWQAEFDSARGELAEAVAANDDDAIADGLTRLEDTVAGLVAAESYLASLEAERAQLVADLVPVVAD